MKEQERCSDCGNSGAVKTGEDEYLTCPCINDNLKIETMTSYQNTIMDLLKGETPKAKHDYLVALLLDRDKFAIEFAKWMSIEGFTYSDSFGYCLSENPKYCDNDGFPIEHSLEQLLQLFHSQKQTQG